jgi:hypothetical protein
MWLTRKGFGTSGQPAGNRSNATFDGWAEAFIRYNGRTKKDGTGYSQTVYWPKINARYQNPNVYVPIEQQ